VLQEYSVYATIVGVKEGKMRGRTDLRERDCGWG